MDIDKVILKINIKTILNSLRDILINALIAILIVIFYIFIFEEAPPALLYIVLLLFFIIFYLYPTISIFYSYYTHDHNVEIDLDSEGFFYTKDKKKIRYIVKDIKEVNVFLTAYKKNNESARLAHTKFFFTEIVMVSGTSIILTSLLSENLYKELIKFYSNVPFNFKVVKNTSLKKNII
ncbi:hypothetical protein M2T82_06835 [Elizabethkingia ursingii]|uniref:hypothetical protein n=1 Tax=Elizabethkingia ursingii TaxID=1756150 RepID=UPI002011D513|nr:hypothetical protein [Elizabethkingia ursingii]MCL1667776.1 hypothetical protein [Elizabethkingia ursingii]